MVKQRLDLAVLGGAIWISHAQYAKDLEESITAEDRAEEGEVGSVICTCSNPSFRLVSCTITMFSTTAMKPYISSTVTGLQFLYSDQLEIVMVASFFVACVGGIN